MFYDDCCDIPNLVIFIFKSSMQTGEGLKNALFELKGNDGSILKGMTNAKGLLSFRVMPCTKYTLREITPPPGYEISNQVYNICVESCGCIFVNGESTNRINIINKSITASFTAIKININTDEPLAGALYTLYLNTVPIGSTYSTVAGEVTFSDLLPGEYELSETTPPPGFQINLDRLPVIVAPDGSVTILGEDANGYRLINVPLEEFIFRKLNASTNQPLADAAFQLTNNGLVVATAVSDSDGIVNFGIVAPGNYEMTESVTPPGFLPNERVYQVVITVDGNITVDGIGLDNFQVENVVLPGFSFIKSSNVTGMSLSGAVFELRQNGTVIAESISDLSGFISFSSLLPGIYQMTEVIPPAGYMNNATIYRVEVLNDGTITIDGMPYQDFSISNDQVEFTVIKTDEAGNPLSGSTFALRSHGIEIQTRTSGFDGLMNFSNIMPGTYTLLETKSTDGFELNPFINTVVVTELGNVIINEEMTTMLSVINTPLPPIDMPHVLGWMRSSETFGFVPGARIPNLAPQDGVFDGWDFPWARDNTLMQYFENNEILAAALSSLYTQEALGISESLFDASGRTVDETFVWDGGSGHQFFTGYFNGAVTGGWASWANLNVPDTLLSPQTQLPVEGGYTPYHYSLRRFTAYLDVDFSSYKVDSAFLVSQFPSDTPDEFVFPLNDSIFVFVNGRLVYWTSTDLIGSGNVAQNRLFFEGRQGVFMTKEFVGAPPVDARFVFTDGWYLTIGGTFRIADIAPYLRDGKNVIDVIADDYYFGGGMSRINTEFSVTPL